MPEALNTRATLLEESMRRAFGAIEALTEKEKKLDAALARLADARIATGRSSQETERRFQETERLRQPKDRGFPRTDASIEDPLQARMDAGRSRQLDARIAELLADIRKLPRNRP